MTEEFPLDLFERVYRRAPSDTDRNRLLNVKLGLGLSDRDELWPVIMTLDHYTKVNNSARIEIVKAVEGLPDQLKAAVVGTQAAAAEKADQAVARAVEKGMERLTQAVVERSQTAAGQVSKRHLIVAACFGGIVAMACLGAGAWTGYFVAASKLDTCTSKGFLTTEGRMGCFID